MIKWISKIHWGKVLLIGFLYTILSTLIRMIEIIWTMKFYTMPQYFGVWNPLMMPASPAGGPVAGPPPVQFRIISAILSFATGMSLTLVYYYLRDYLPKGYIKRSVYFADLMAGTSFIFFTFPVYLLFNVPLLLLVFWFASTFVLLVLTSLMIVKIVK